MKEVCATAFKIQDSRFKIRDEGGLRHGLLKQRQVGVTLDLPQVQDSRFKIQDWVEPLTSRSRSVRCVRNPVSRVRERLLALN